MKQPANISLNDIPDFAANAVSKLKGGEIFALTGPLGSGKTTFVKAVGKKLKIKRHITSPTFTLMNSFAVKLPANKKQVFIFHLDLYRTKNYKEVKALGITEFWGNPNTVTFIEWADKIKKYLPKKTFFIKFVS
jgi:tRNA threonylcarbamoyladenosine biosynthesis protein TsaE